MPVIRDYQAVKETYQEAAELGVGLPVFCMEDRETLEAVLAAALEYGQEIGVDNLPVVPAWTVRYPPRGQMTLITACGNPALGTQLMFSDLEVFMSEDSPYRKLRVLPHLDHGFPWLDGDIFERFVAEFASVMFDASEKPFEENIRLTAEYVEKVRGRVVVEGAVDEIFSEGNAEFKNELTSVEQASRFLRETGVDLIVPNVGTEHRSTGDQIHYDSGRAREISAAVGNIMCLHGTSSVKPEDLPQVPKDGFVKVNIYTTLAVHGGQAVAREVLNNLGRIFSEQQLRQLIQDGILAESVLTSLGSTPIKPKLDFVANPPRRDAWFGAVKSRCKDFLEVLNCRGYAK